MASLPLGSTVVYRGGYREFRGKTATVVEPRVSGDLADRWATVRFADGTLFDAEVANLAAVAS